MFDVSKFLPWKKDYLRWRDLHWYLGGAQLLSVTGLNANATLRKFHIPFSAILVASPLIEPLGSSLNCYKRNTPLVPVKGNWRIWTICSLRRENSDAIQSFWAKYQELVRNLDGSSVQISDSTMCTRLLKNLNFPSAMRFAITPPTGLPTSSPHGGEPTEGLS